MATSTEWISTARPRPRPAEEDRLLTVRRQRHGPSGTHDTSTEGTNMRDMMRDYIIDR